MTFASQSATPASTTLILANAEATRQLGILLGKTLNSGSVLLLEGDLGSGKTTLVQGIGAGLGIAEWVDSPTFTLVNEYLSGRSPLYHLDLYRLNPAEVEDLLLETYWEGTEVEPGIVVIEWAERLTYKPHDYLVIQLTNEGEGRKATLIPMGRFKIGDLELS
ncbi:MAG: tRNA (adenosine(37)-N6)-threonylcarbamoyltransferase complex ATPase subunit type 1 TsaE [Oscillatoriales cyanobacterium C42_A2020_001]|nr:tRNA (adenosine(37)-N6)-threonylcarbamoyltransferase complex ATPase subunit type 1 TsaE [Leptolyngbyaceae cyanobacterium C42_A2020_001]